MDIHKIYIKYLFFLVWLLENVKVHMWVMLTFMIKVIIHDLTKCQRHLSKQWLLSPLRGVTVTYLHAHLLMAYEDFTFSKCGVKLCYTFIYTAHLLHNCCGEGAVVGIMERRRHW